MQGGMECASVPCYLRMPEWRSCSKAALRSGVWVEVGMGSVSAQQGVGCQGRGGFPSIAGSSRHRSSFVGESVGGPLAVHPLGRLPSWRFTPQHTHTRPWSRRGSPIQVTAPSFGPNPAKGGAPAPCSSFSFGWRSGTGKQRGRGRARALPFQMQPETRGN